ncbi:MAG: RNA methyltransferase [Chlamydiota bacterium]
MLTKIIESLQHPLIKHWSELRLDKAYREEHKRLIITGEKLIRELAKVVSIHNLIALSPDSRIKAEARVQVTDAILKKITGLAQPDGFAAEVSMPQPQNIREKKFLLILDQIGDPGNLGTLLRTALALRWEGVILTPGTVDLFNDKALRAAKGATFHLPYDRLSTSEIAQLIRENKIYAFTGDTEGEPLGRLAFHSPLALILSSESGGPGPWTSSCSRKITIPMDKKVESLNVATSGAILLYTMRNFS